MTAVRRPVARPGSLGGPRSVHARLAALLAGGALALSLVGSAAPAALAASGTYRNPLLPVVPGDGLVESCADPTVIEGQEGEGRWYLYCTADPLNDEDRTASGFNFRQIPMMTSTDLVDWTYVGEAFAGNRPPYATPNAGLWAPEIVYFEETGLYHLYYTVTDTTLPGGGSAIGVATSPTPTGPWTHSATPVIEPHGADCCGPDSRRWVFDPEVLRTATGDYIYYGSYFGGISVRSLVGEGMTTSPATQSNVAIANKFEGAEVESRDGWYYLFASATDCCRGPLTGYAVMVGRSRSPLGPFVDREAVALNDNEGPNEADPTDGRAGGTPVIAQNGNRWVGTGHNTMFVDHAGQWWTIYHAVDVNEPYFAGATGFTKRPALMDAIDWVDGWPRLNGGSGPSDTPQQAPAARPGDKTNHRLRLDRPEQPGAAIVALSDTFGGSSLDGDWSWIREPAAGTWHLADGAFRMDTQAADLFEGSNNASVLVENVPTGDYVVETKVRLNVPSEGCCFNYVQAGLVVMANDDEFVKLTNVSIWNTRQTEFAKEVAPNAPGYPRYGNTVVGPPGEWTWLRIVKEPSGERSPTGVYGGSELYTAYTSHDGLTWSRGGTWTHHLGDAARIGLVAMGGSGFEAEFDDVRVSRLRR
ncbi:MAG TPA: family 43 glycosylhydrolase [Patescibacteria group bacterium]|nr:family 43 glycosylhydrolase [Patescibacteria group bacterium]